MTDTETLNLIREALNTHLDNVEDDDGDRHLADSGDFIEALVKLVDGNPGQIAQVRREGWTQSDEPAQHECPEGTWHVRNGDDIYAAHPDGSTHRI
jgi:hypothetical protein